MISCDQERKLGDRRRSDTVVVSTVNYANQGLKEDFFQIFKFLKKMKKSERKKSKLMTYFY